ncbi:MAG: dihydroorotate dehydrogenase-like protein [Anaerolineae bacterium]|nr:dihydroorotate dehydrogenase-like protein [Anaerolineae bacterium]
MVDLRTTYLGLQLKNPLVASASPLSEKVEMARQLEEAGIGAIVMYSLFEEQIIHESLELDYYLERGTYTYPEALTYFPDVGRYALTPDKYLDRIRELKRHLSVPIIASLNGASPGGWIKYAQKIEDAGADALELNIYYLAIDPNLTAAELEERYVQLVQSVRASVRIPLAVKLSPFFTALPHTTKRLVEAGADGLVLFNRFYQPDFDLDTLEVVPNLTLSRPEEMRLPLRWIAILYGRVSADLALTTGVHSGRDVAKAILAGAAVAMTTSALLLHGPHHAATMLTELQQWMEEHGYTTVTQMRGAMSQQAVAEPAAFERANYAKVLSSFDLNAISVRER